MAKKNKAPLKDDSVMHRCITTLTLLLHTLASLLFVLSFAEGAMRARYNVYPTLLEVFVCLISLGFTEVVLALLVPTAITGLLLVQITHLKRPGPYNVMGGSMLLLFGIAAVFLNSNSMQGPFSFLPDGIRTTVEVLSGRLSENDWSSDTWVPQASMTWWFLLWLGLLVVENATLIMGKRQNANKAREDTARKLADPPR